MMDALALSQEDSLSEKSKGAYVMYKNTFEKWRKGEPIFR